MISRFEKQLDTIFQVTHSSNFNTSIQALMLIQQISATKHYSTDRFYRTLYESLLDPRLITSSKHIMYLNLLYRSLKADTSIKRVKAFVKRLLQIIHLHEPPFICGVLYLVNELMTAFPSIKNMLSTPEDHDSDSEDEHFVDVPENPTTSTNTEKRKHPRYDPRKRDPDHADAELSCLWELLPLQAHYHPSVHVLAQKIIDSQPIKEKPDPTIYTLMNFLDKFAFRNPKVKQVTHGSSIMQPMAGAGTLNTGSYLITDRSGGDKYGISLNSEAFWKRKVDEVRDDEVFFHAYFEKSGKAKQKTRKDKKKRDADSDDSDAGEDEIWKALVQSRPEVEGGDDDDDLSDFDMDMTDDEDEDAESVDGEDGGVELNLGSEDEEEAPEQPDDDEDDSDNFNFDDEDADAFVASDEEVPVDWETEEEEVEEEDVVAQLMKDKGDKEKRGKKKRKLKHLPTFASADDYAKLIGDDPDDV